jgi:hypothetical protein
MEIREFREQILSLNSSNCGNAELDRIVGSSSVSSAAVQSRHPPPFFFFSNLPHVAEP